MKNNISILTVSICMLLISCTSPAPRSVQETAPVPSPAPAPQVKPAEKDGILVSKGVIKSDNEIPVFSRITGQLNEVRLINGRKVRKGEVLFSLDDRELVAKVNLCRAELEQAKLMMEDILIGQGYKRAEFDGVPSGILEIARIKSGCNVKELELEIAQDRLDNAKIKSPVSGVIANVAPMSYSYVNPGETLCRVVDPDHLIVVFSVLETELRRFKVGSEVQVSSMAYSEERHTAVVRSIGSIVDESGMIAIEATLDDNKNLIPGMTAIVRL